jgi:hypothetical protein
MKDGPPQIEVLRRSDIDRIHEVSAAKAGPWASWFDEMARKSAVRRLCKYLPYDPELEKAAAMSDDVETGLTTSLDLSESGTSLEEDLAARDAKTNGGPTTTTTTDKGQAKALPEKTAAAAAVLGLDQPSNEGEKAEVKVAAPAKKKGPAPEKAQGKPPAEAKAGAPVASWPPCATCGQPITGDDEPVRTNLGEGKGIGWRHGRCLPPGLAGGDGNKAWGMPSKEPADAEPPPGVLEGEREPGVD